MRNVDCPQTEFIQNKKQNKDGLNQTNPSKTKTILEERKADSRNELRTIKQVRGIFNRFHEQKKLFVTSFNYSNPILKSGKLMCVFTPPKKKTVLGDYMLVVDVLVSGHAVASFFCFFWLLEVY